MATRYLALVRQEDYEAFRRILGSYLPCTYDEWRNLRADRGHQIAGTGHIARSVETDPDEFSAWLTERGEAATLDALDTFAFHKGAAVKRD